MPYRNPVVGGNGTLIRDQIQSSDFVDGVSGWQIRRDGVAQFNEVTVRGEVRAQQGDNIVVLGVDDLLEAPGLFFYDGDITLPASITGTADTNEVVLVLTTSNLNDPLFTNPGTQLTVGEQLGNFLRDPGGADEQGIQMFFGDTEYPGGASGLQLIGLPDGIQHVLAETHYPIYLGGNVKTGSTSDTSATTSGGVTITDAAIANVPVVQDRAYRIMVWVRVAGSTLNNRAQFAIFDGLTQLGQDRLYRITGATSTFVDVPLEFIWRATATETISSIELVMGLFSGSGSVTARVESDNHYMTVEEIGDADKYPGL